MKARLLLDAWSEGKQFCVVSDLNGTLCEPGRDGAWDPYLGVVGAMSSYMHNYPFIIMTGGSIESVCTRFLVQQRLLDSEDDGIMLPPHSKAQLLIYSSSGIHLSYINSEKRQLETLRLHRGLRLCELTALRELSEAIQDKFQLQSLVDERGWQNELGQGPGTIFEDKIGDQRVVTLSPFGRLVPESRAAFLKDTAAVATFFEGIHWSNEWLHEKGFNELFVGRGGDHSIDARTSTKAHAYRHLLSLLPQGMSPIYFGDQFGAPGVVGAHGNDYPLLELCRYVVSMDSQVLPFYEQRPDQAICALPQKQDIVEMIHYINRINTLSSLVRYYCLDSSL